MRRMVKGKECIILREDGWGGFVSIEVEKLTMKVSEVLTEGTYPDQFKNMPLHAWIKVNEGWKQHRQAMKDEGFDIE